MGVFERYQVRTYFESNIGFNIGKPFGYGSIKNFEKEEDRKYLFELWSQALWRLKNWSQSRYEKEHPNIKDWNAILWYFSIEEFIKWMVKDDIEYLKLVLSEFMIYRVKTIQLTSLSFLQTPKEIPSISKLLEILNDPKIVILEMLES